MEKFILPPSPSWNLSNVLACNDDGVFAFGSRSEVVLINFKSQSTFDVKFISKAHKEKINVLVFSPSKGSFKNCLATCSDDSIVRVWDFQESHVLYSHSGHKETIKEHRKKLKTGVVNNLVDAFLHEVNISGNKNGSSFSEKQLLILLLDMFMAGSETTSNTLAFTILFLLKNPHVQEAAHKELDCILDPGKLPTLKDRSRLTYIEAIILESQRLGNVAPITPPHRAKKDTTLNGYMIPKDTAILINIYDVHMNCNYWDDPETFRPERFLNARGKIIQHDYFIPFGLGRRRCLGEALAKPSLFLFLASLLSYFEFALAPGENLPKTTAVDGATLSPPHFKCVLKPRNKQ